MKGSIRGRFFELDMDIPSPRISVALVDDHTLLRNMLGTMIGNMPAYQVVLDAANGVEFVQALEASSTHISVAVVDLHMPVMDGYETIAWLRKHRPGTRALALTFERTQQAMERAMAAGACGFVLKDASYAEFKAALDQVAMLGRYDNHSELEDVDDEKRELPAGLGTLTERELEFIHLACDPRELTMEQISELMDVHRRTVDGYRNAAFAKLEVKTRAGLMRAAIQCGLVPS
ncbi:MAG: response regulator transcription factor [Flavobacteriales bacterium]